MKNEEFNKFCFQYSPLFTNLGIKENHIIFLARTIFEIIHTSAQDISKGTVKFLTFFLIMDINSRAYCKTRHVGRMWNFNPGMTRNSRYGSLPVSRKCSLVSRKCIPVPQKCILIPRNCVPEFQPEKTKNSRKGSTPKNVIQQNLSSLYAPLDLNITESWFPKIVSCFSKMYLGFLIFIKSFMKKGKEFNG